MYYIIAAVEKDKHWGEISKWGFPKIPMIMHIEFIVLFSL